MDDKEWAKYMIARQAVISGMEDKALNAAGEYEAAKARFTVAKADHIHRSLANHDNVTEADADFTAGSDARVKAAIGDCGFYNAEARMYALMVMMLKTPAGYTPPAAL